MASSSGGANLRVKISADLADIKQGLGLLRGELAKVKSQGDRAAPDSGKWSNALASIRNQLAAIGGAYAALRAVRWYAGQADQAAGLASRLRLATKSQEEFEAAYRATYQVAQKSSAEWEGIVGFYASLAQTTGMSQKGVLALTDVVTKSFKVSGASAQDASRGIVQLQQALAGGVLRSQEFNTILETSPRIVQALATHFGISFGQVRQYVNEGKISSREFAEAMLTASDDIQSEFEGLPVTVSNAVTQFKNALLSMVGGTDEATGASNDMATAIQDLARILESPEVRNGVNTFVAGISKAVGWMAKFVAKAAEITKFVGEEIAARIAGPSIDDPVRIEQAIERQRAIIAKASGADAEVARQRLAELESMLKLSREMAAQAAKQEAALAKAGEGAKKANVNVQELLEGMSPGGKQKKIEKLAESTVLLQDEVVRAQKALDQQFKDGAISVADYYAQRVELQQQLIDLQIRQAQSELGIADTLRERRRLEEQIEKLTRDRAEIGARAAREQENAEKALNEERGRALQQKFGSITGNLSTTEQSVSAQMDAGTLGQVEGERRLQEVRQQTLEQLRALREEQQAYIAELAAKFGEDSPEIVAAQQGLMQLDAAMADVKKSQQQFRQSIEDEASGALGGFFNDLIDGAKSFKDAFRDMVISFLKGVAQMIAQQLALNAVKSISRSFGAAHGGGIAGQLRMIRNNIDPSVFSFAPRYHGGGIAGLQNNEVPAILQRGEVIRTQQQEAALQANLAAGRDGGRSRVTTPIVAIGDDAVANALAGAAGENVVLTHVRNNWGGLAGGA